MIVIICVIVGWLWLGPLGAFLGLQLGGVIYFFQFLFKRLGNVQADFAYEKPPHQPQQTYPNFSTLEQAYQTLGIQPNTSDTDVKKAYHRMAMQYHPDRHTNASEHQQKEASEKFRSINQAYEYIKAYRKIK